MAKRPKPRPEEDKTEAAPRPKRRPSTDNMNEAFAETEFLFGIDEAMRNDPIARLGYKTTHKTEYGDKGFTSDIIDGPVTGPKQGKRRVLMTSEYGASPDAYSHEYRHSGFDIIRALHEENPKGFVERYGEDAAILLNQADEEMITELLDNPDATFIKPDGTEGSMEDTIQFIQPYKVRKYKDKTLGPDDTENYEYYQKGLDGLKRVAQDVLMDVEGEPAKYQDMSTGPEDRKGPRQEDGWFDSVRKVLGFAEGGMAMEEQMSEAMGVDPVSGNEVPPGAMPEEVRDDIPAQLSEGEYVIPADVVRYFGVRFFEDLRNEAKMGWMQMEQNGRIGGEPMGMDEELPFDISELQVEDDMAEEQKALPLE